MIRIDYTLTLKTDAEPGTGLGTELIDDLVPRDHRGHPVFPGSHIKGLVRESLEEIAALRGWSREFIDDLFGAEGDAKSDGAQGRVRFSQLSLHRERGVAATRASAASLISRTAIDAGTGTVRSGSLRTVECIPRGTRFKGSTWAECQAGSAQELAVRLGLASLGSIGGNRRRGAGECTVAFVSDDRLPSALLSAIGSSPTPASTTRVQAAPSTGPGTGTSLGSETVWVQLTFVADEPLCCPVVPLTKTNLLHGGFSVPASAVQGAILDRLNAESPALATATFEHASFRAWPLLPCAHDGEDSSGRFPVWTSLTHKMSKLAAGIATGTDVMFADSMLEPVDLTKVPRNAPLKAADGVLVRVSNGEVHLWRAADMPRHLSAHVNLRQGTPLLYTVDALAPMTLRGLVCMPRQAWETFAKSIQRSDRVWFGKSRSVRGGGALRAEQLSDAMKPVLEGPHETFIVQSPLLVESRDPAKLHSGDVLKELVQGSWGVPVERAEASLGMRFGWNRHAIGDRTDGRNRLRAATVVLPGSIFRLREPARDVVARLLQGIGGGRERGFGAVLPHPGKACKRMADAIEPPTLKSIDNAGDLASVLLARSQESGLSASQVARLEASLVAGPNGLRDRISELKVTSPKNYDRWKSVISALEEIMQKKPAESTLRRAMRAWRDALAAEKGGSR